MSPPVSCPTTSTTSSFSTLIIRWAPKRLASSRRLASLPMPETKTRAAPAWLAAPAQRPLKAVGHDRAYEYGGLRRKIMADLGREDIGRQINIIREATEQVWRIGAGGPAAVARALLAESGSPPPAIRTAPAAHGSFKNDAISFFEVMDRRCVSAELDHPAQNLVAENNRE